MLDGEVAVLGGDGISDFQALHSRHADSAATLLAFDVLQLDARTAYVCSYWGAAVSAGAFSRRLARF